MAAKGDISMKRFLLASLCVLFSATSAEAKPGEDGPAIGKRIKARMLQVRTEVLRYEVGLSEADADKVLRVLKKFDPQRKALHKRKRAAKRAGKRLMQSDSTDQAAFERVMDDMLAVGAEHLELQKRQRAALRGLLTPKQQLKLFHSMKRIKRRLKRKMQEFKDIGPERRRGRRGSLRRRGGGGDAMGAPAPGGLGPRHPGAFEHNDDDWGDNLL